MKKILAFAMAAAMTLSLAACGGNGGIRADGRTDLEDVYALRCGDHE